MICNLTPDMDVFIQTPLLNYNQQLLDVIMSFNDSDRKELRLLAKQYFITQIEVLDETLYAYTNKYYCLAPRTKVIISYIYGGNDFNKEIIIN